MNKSFRINGKKGAIQQPTRYGRNESGFYSIVQFEGTALEVKIRAAAYDLIGANYEVEELRGGRCRLNAYLTWANPTQVATEVPVNVWELEPVEVEKDLLEADFQNTGAVGEVSKINRQKIKTHLETTPEDDGVPPTFVADDTQEAALSLYYLMRAGVRAFPIEASVIRHTAMVSNRYSTKVAFTNVGRIFSSSSLVSIEGVPSNLLFDVPSTPTANQFIEYEGDLQYGWRKSRPQVTEAAYQKRQIVRRWQFGLWAVKLHGSVL